jgi:hypothetical protein
MPFPFIGGFECGEIVGSGDFGCGGEFEAGDSFGEMRG